MTSSTTAAATRPTTQSTGFVANSNKSHALLPFATVTVPKCVQHTAETQRSLTSRYSLTQAWVASQYWRPKSRYGYRPGKSSLVMWRAAKSASGEKSLDMRSSVWKGDEGKVRGKVGARTRRARRSIPLLIHSRDIWIVVHRWDVCALKRGHGLKEENGGGVMLIL